MGKLFGGGTPSPELQPLVAPVPPVEEASVEIGEEEKKKKTRTGKKKLKIPLATSEKTGLKL